MRKLALAALLLAGAADDGGWDKPGWQLTFHDEFDGTALDGARWSKRFKWGEARINDELQAYVDDAFEVRDGVLAIVGSKQPGSYAGQTFAYTSGILCSAFEQRYGYFEARLKVPAGQGMWPAFWLLHTPAASDVNEIDIHEILGNAPTVAHMTNHWGTAYAPGQHFFDTSSFDGPDFSAGFHTFGLEWSPDALVWTIDGEVKKRHTGEGIPSVPMYVILNLAIGGSWPGAPDATTPFPARYQVDYVRVYARPDEARGGAGGGCSTGGRGALTAALLAMGLLRRQPLRLAARDAPFRR
jgi:beta-glucanase (GH16 family)